MVIDHLIPLSSNKLNKQLRGVGATRLPSGTVKKAPHRALAQTIRVF